MKNNNNNNNNKNENEDMEWDEVDELARMMARNLMSQPPEKQSEFRVRKTDG